MTLPLEFFKALNVLDQPYFYVLILPFIGLGWGWKVMARIAFILFVSHITNGILKELFHSPRPCQIDPSLGLIPIGGFGFPSGAAQTVVLCSALLLSYSRTVWTWGISIAYVSLVSYSRIYLGVHFPSDILGGWLVGYLLYLFYKWLFDEFDKKNPLYPSI